MDKLKTILLIDDDPLIQRLFGGRLSKKGYNTLYAHNGIEGREMARRMKPDLILLDVHMPGSEDGFQIAQRMREEEELKKTPISLLTGEDISYDAEKLMLQTMCVHYMHKGIDEKEFIENIQKLLGESSE